MEAGSIISTKFRVPHLPRNAVARERLTLLADELRSKRLALIASPSGFGKTSLAVAWARSLDQKGCRVAWLSLDESDDEIVRFHNCLVTAVQTVCPDIRLSAMTTASDGSWLSMPTVIGNLINVLSNEEKETFLFIDDYHYLRDPRIHESITYLISNAPECFHLVLISCTVPPLPLAKLRAQEELIELDALKLSFDLAEIQQFLHLSSMRCDSVQVATNLHRKTGGWIAAITLASHGLSDAADPEGYVAELSGESRQIGDYLALIWERLPADVRGFMLRTCILDRLTGPLCEAVTGCRNGQRMLDAIERQHLLLVPLDNEGTWFRNHSLMSDYLRRRVREYGGKRVADLHRRAATWYAANDIWNNAIAHSIAAGDRQQAAAWIEQRCSDERVRRGDLMGVLGWYKSFPEEMALFSNQVRLAITWAHMLSSRVTEARNMLSVIKRDIDQSPHEAESAVGVEYRLLCSTLSMRTDDDSARNLAVALECLAQRPSDPWLSDAIGNIVRHGYLKSGDYRRFLEVPWFSSSDPKDVRTAYPVIYREVLEGMMNMQQGRFAVAERHYRQAYRVAKQHLGEGSVEIATTAAMIAEALYEQNCIGEAVEILYPYLDQITASGSLDPVLAAYRVLARANILQGNSEQADAFLQEGIRIGRDRNWGRLPAVLLLERVKLYLLDQRMTEAEVCVAQQTSIALAHPVRQTCSWSEIHVVLARAQAYLAVARGDYDNAICKLRSVFEDAAATQNCRLAMRTGTEFAAALMQSQQPSKAGEVFDQVLALAIPAGAVRAIADHGAATMSLLQLAQRRGPPSPQREEFLRTVIKALRVECLVQEDATPSPKDYQLSARESSVLTLVAGGHSNKQIAKTLGITPETVKSHLKNSFIKLKVTTRAQAVGRLFDTVRSNRT